MPSSIRHMRAHVLAALVRRLGGRDRMDEIYRMTGIFTDAQIAARERERLRRPWWQKLISR